MKFLKTLSIFAFVLALTSCVSTLSIDADYDKATDFSVFKTFSILDLNSNTTQHLLPSVKSTLYDAVQKELENRGYVYQKTGGQLSVGLSILIEDKIEYRTDGAVNYGVGYGGYGYGYGYYGYGYSAPQVITPVEYRDGTLIIDIFDEAKKNLIWQGQANDRLSDSKSQNKNKIPAYVRYIFAKYPGKAAK